MDGNIRVMYALGMHVNKTSLAVIFHLLIHKLRRDKKKHYEMAVKTNHDLQHSRAREKKKTPTIKHIYEMRNSENFKGKTMSLVALVLMAYLSQLLRNH